MKIQNPTSLNRVRDYHTQSLNSNGMQHIFNKLTATVYKARLNTNEIQYIFNEFAATINKSTAVFKEFLKTAKVFVVRPQRSLPSKHRSKQRKHKPTRLQRRRNRQTKSKKMKR